MARVTITGDKKLDKALRGLEPRVAKKVIRQAMRRALKPVQAAVKREEPHGETGQLARSPKIRAGKRTRKGVITLFVLIGEKDFPDGYYGAFKEYGTSKMPADPAMRRAYDETAARAKLQAIEEIRAGIDREAAQA
jgi:HK97 gp10 family phage protein